MQSMVARDEVDALVAERVWQESEKALARAGGQRILQVLRECGALGRIYPEIDALFGVPQPAEWHPEIDTGLHTLMVLDQAALLSEDPKVRFAALLHDVGKGATPPVEWPRHRGHEERSVALIEALAARLRVPSDFRELALIVARYHGSCIARSSSSPQTILEFMERADAFRRPERFAQALHRLRGGFARPDRPGDRALSAASVPARRRDAAAASSSRLPGIIATHPEAADRGAVAPPARCRPSPRCATRCAGLRAPRDGAESG